MYRGQNPRGQSPGWPSSQYPLGPPGPPPPPPPHFPDRFQGPGPIENFCGQPPGPPPPPFMYNSYPGGPPPGPSPPFDNSWNSNYRPPARFDHPPPMQGDRFNSSREPSWRSHSNDYPSTMHSNIYQSQNSQYGSAQNSTNKILKTKTDNVNTSPKTEGQRWLGQWLQERNIAKAQETKQRRCSSIPDARKQIRRANILIEQLEEAKNDLANASHECSGVWNEKLKNVLSMKEELDGIQNNLDVENLRGKYQRILQKRARLKRQRQERYQEKQEAEERRKQRHEEIDQWQAAIYEKELEIKREKDMKAAADATLSEVRKKLNEARRCKEVLERLTKLRQVRKDAMERMGLYTAKESDTNFATRRDKLSEIMERQLQTYQSEEMALKVMLEAEAEETKEKIKEQVSANKEKQQARLKTRLRHLLFGLNEVPGMNEEIRPFYDYYTSAESNLQSFLTIRQQWDSYIVPEGSSGGSNVPPGWVVPSVPSNSTWESTLKQSSGKT